MINLFLLKPACNINSFTLIIIPLIRIAGTHHYYLGRTRYAIFHSFSFGLNVIGWVFDLLRMPWLVRKANEEITKMKAGIKVERPPYSLLDAYFLAVPLGFFGLHHFYLGNTKRGILFLCTLGVFGLGWLADMFQMPLIVSEANKERELRERLTGAFTHQQNQASTTTVVVVPAGGGYQASTGYLIEQPPAYAAYNTTGEVVERSCMTSGRLDNHEHNVQHAQLPPQNGYNSMGVSNV